MQTALFDLFTIIPLIGCLVVQGCILILIVNGVKRHSQKIPNSFSFLFAILTVVSLMVGGVLVFIIPPITQTFSLLLYSSCILLASIFMLVFVVQYISSVKKREEAPVAEEATTETGFADKKEEEVREDPLVNIGEDFLAHVAEAFTGEINLVRLLDFVNETLIKNTEADGGIVFLADDFEDIISAKSFSGSFPPPYKLPSDLPHKQIRVETNFKYAQFNLGETIFGEVAATGKSVLIENGEDDSRIYVNGPEEFLKPGSYIFVPLMLKDRVIGVAGLARLPGKEPFTKENFRTANVLSSYSGSAINNIYNVQEILEQADLEREASIASRIQKTLHPKRLPDLPEVGFGAFFNATKGVCGDYYDVILARKDRIALVIADVAGKGIQSSMVMSMLRSILHLVTNTTKTAGTILDWVNKGITGKIDMDHYATLAFVSYCPSEHTIEYASAGHQPLLLWHAATNSIETILQKTDPIGVERSSEYTNLKLTVATGDIIILFTDGLVESLNEEGHQYGSDSLAQVIKDTHAMNAKEIANEVKQNIQNFIGSANIHDDQTLVVMKIKA